MHLTTYLSCCPIMAVALIGSIGPFVEGEEDFENYCTRIELFFEANSIEEKKVASFLSVIGPKLYALVQNLVAPKKPKDCTYANLTKVLKDHYKPKVITIYERFKFYNRKQEIGESVTEFIAGIRAAARTCKFGTSLDEMMRDRLVVGIRDEATQRSLLCEEDLTFAKAIEKATAREIAAKDVKEMGRPSNINAIRSNASGYANKNNKNSNDSNNAPKSSCFGCGQMHWKRDCPFKDAECHKCNGKGHIKKMCRSNKDKKNMPNKNKRYNQTHTIQQNNDLYSQLDEYDQYIYCVKSSAADPIIVPVSLNGINTSMELDTGATRSLISKDKFDELWSANSKNRPILQKCEDKLKVYGGSPLPTLGEICVNMRHIPTNKSQKVTLIVVDSLGPSLLGRDILRQFNLLNEQIQNISTDSKLKNDLTQQFPELFSEGLGCYKGLKVSIDVDTSVKPVYCKARPIPYAMRNKVEDGLTNLEQQGVITPISHSDWAAPIVPVLKSDNTIRICGDYKLTANKAAVIDKYPIPKINDLFSNLSGGKFFSKLDMSQAYAQLELTEESQKYTVINTCKGLFKYNRLCFGISSAPGIFQRAMEQLLRDIPGVLCYLDDILICGETEAEHLERLNVVLTKLQDAGLRLRLDKCAFKVTEVSYLGYRIDSNGIHPTKDKVRAIVEAPNPTNKKQVQSYLGMINFYRRFIPNCSTILEPLNSLLRDDIKWVWGKEQEKAFKLSKLNLLNSEALVHFNPKLPITIVADSSAYGVGAVLCHDIDGQERPVTFASRTLSQSERNYSQIEKEALAIIFALKKFHNYAWGQNIKIVTDHKPLLGIFSPEKPIPPMASGRIQRWALMLQAYKLTIVHRSGAVLGTADALSRLPLPKTEENVPVPCEWTNLVNFLDHSPVTAVDIKNASRTDITISTVIKHCELGWPLAIDEGNPEVLPYFRRKTELHVQGGCLLWGYRIVVPPKLRKSIIEELHGGHVGASRMKEFARSYVWWPNLDKDLEDVVKQCPECFQNARSPGRAELHPWEWPSQPWHRLHIDYAGPVQNKYFLVLIDAHSKWAEIFPTSGPNAKETIKHLRHCFCEKGLPVTIVSDNGPCFTSAEFQDFLSQNGIRHVTSAVYKPSTNGLAEKMVQNFKTILKKSSEPTVEVIDKFLFKYRIMPHTTTGVSPAELLYKRKLRCRLDLLNPTDRLESKVTHQQENQKRNYCSSPRKLPVASQDPIAIRNYGNGPKWLPAHAEEQTGPVSYRCRLQDGTLVRRHQDQILRRVPKQNIAARHLQVPPAESPPGAPVAESLTTGFQNRPVALQIPEQNAGGSTSLGNLGTMEPSLENLGTMEPSLENLETVREVEKPPPVIRRSNRKVKPPARLDL